MSKRKPSNRELPESLPKPVIPKHRAKGICIVLDDDCDKNKIEDLLLAVKQLKGVARADWIDFDGFDDHCNRSRIKLELKQQLKDVIGG